LEKQVKEKEDRFAAKKKRNCLKMRWMKRTLPKWLADDTCPCKPLMEGEIQKLLQMEERCI